MEHNQRFEVVRYLQTRFSCRKFTSEAISDEYLDAIIDATLSTASGGNLQPWSIIIERDPERNRLLSAINGKQPFIEKAAVNLIFLLDWYKLSVYAEMNDAPFTCNKSCGQFFIAWDDVVCAAQTAETAAHFLGLGCCFAGTCNSCAPDLAKMYNLPQMTFPVLILSIGHPDMEPKSPKKLTRSMMVFEGMYPQLSAEEICEAYDDKYSGMKMQLPPKEPYRSEFLARFAEALKTSFDEERLQNILQEADTRGYILEVQRRFGLHYHAAAMYRGGETFIKAMAMQNIRPFDILEHETATPEAD